MPPAGLIVNVGNTYVRGETLITAAMNAATFTNMMLACNETHAYASGENALAELMGQDTYELARDAASAGSAMTLMAAMCNPRMYGYGSETNNIRQMAGYDNSRSESDLIELSNSNIQHIRKHTFDGMAEQAQYLTDEQLANKLDNTSFFNKDWSEKETIRYTQEAYNILMEEGKIGLQSVKVNGEMIYVYIKEDGTFDTAYGVYKYTVNDFR